MSITRPHWIAQSQKRSFVQLKSARNLELWHVVQAAGSLSLFLCNNFANWSDDAIAKRALFVYLRVCVSVCVCAYHTSADSPTPSRCIIAMRVNALSRTRCKSSISKRWFTGSLFRMQSPIKLRARARKWLVCKCKTARFRTCTVQLVNIYTCICSSVRAKVFFRAWLKYTYIHIHSRALHETQRAREFRR